MPEKLTKSHIAALEAAGIAVGALPRDGIEWNEKVWAVFRAGMKYETENIRRETIGECKRVFVGLYEGSPIVRIQIEKAMDVIAKDKGGS